MLNLANLNPVDESLPSNALSGPADLASPLPASTVLLIANRLQQTLDIRSLIEIFTKELASLIRFDSLSYQNSQIVEEINFGDAATHSVRYRLSLPDREQLGALRITRTDPFTDLDSRMIEFAVSQLMYPLRNAILYKIARDAASKDPLTGVNNRSFFDVTMQREIDLSQRHDTQLSILCLDIDHFKRVNDNYGHSVGDKVLRFVAESLQSCVRASDVVFRYGGEEFVVLLSNTDVQGAALLAERIRQRVSSAFLTHKGFPLSVTVSVGVSSLLNADTKESLFERADQALYNAKTQGRNRVVISEAEG